MNVALIGCGGMGTLHCAMATNAGLKIVACGDTVKQKAEALAKGYGADATDDCMALCARADVDIVAVCTPTPTHTQYIVAAAQAGKHVFSEKPFGRAIEQCEQALAAVNKAEVKLMVGHVVRYFDEFEAMKNQVESGVVGKVGFVKTYRGGIFPLGEGGWFGDWEQSGGVTLDTIIHDFDWLRYAFGDPVSVFCQNLKRTFDQKIDYSLVTFRMKSGAIIQVVGTWAHPAGFEVKVDICGDQGMITFNSNEAPMATMMRDTGEGGPGMIVPASPVPVSPYQREWEEFIAWIEGKAEPRVKPEDAVWATRMALAALESAETGQPVEL